MVEQVDREIAAILEAIGPFKFHVTNQENYSGEHREWKEEYTEPKNGSLTEQIVRAAYPLIVHAAEARGMEAAAKIVEASKVSEHIAELAPQLATSINRAFDEVAANIRAALNGGQHE